MPAKNIGKTLKEIRLKTGISQKQAYEYIGVAQSTFSSWETGKAEPPTETLLKLCSLYQVDNILSAFGYDGYKKDGSLQLNMKEVDIIEKYRFISTHSSDGASVVDTVLEREHSIAKQISEQKNYINKLSAKTSLETFPARIWAYYGKIASAGTSVEFADMIAGTKEYPVSEKNKNADYTIGVNGDSMEPLYSDGDVVFVKNTTNLQLGDIGIFQKDNNIYIKQVGENCLISLNPNYDPLKIGDGIRIWGKVLGKAMELD